MRYDCCPLYSFSLSRQTWQWAGHGGWRSLSPLVFVYSPIAIVTVTVMVMVRSEKRNRRSVVVVVVVVVFVVVVTVVVKDHETS